jgi:hypothetical protein
MPIIMCAINFLYLSAAEAGLAYDEGEWVGGRLFDSYDVAYSVCEYCVRDDVLEAVQNAIEPETWTDSHISESPLDVALGWGWEAFCRKVKHESRFVFLSREEQSSGHPDEFTTVEWLQRLEKIIIDNELVTRIPPGTVYWRGRLVDSLDNWTALRSAKDLGSPPGERASNNRMSPAGISFFYGSEDIDTVVAEIGAHSVNRYAVVGAFETLRDLNVLDLTALPELPSVFQESISRQEYGERKFLRAFARDLGKPVSIDGREHIEYVPTQVVTEYLRFIPPFAADGILFRSSQNDGVNCVLFVGPDDCLDDTVPAAPRPPWLEEGTLCLKTDTVKWVRIVASVK